jgi:Ca2+-binding EF-hand superfamily protein
MKVFTYRSLPLVGLTALVMLLTPVLSASSRGEDDKKPAVAVEVRKTKAKEEKTSAPTKAKEEKKTSAPAAKAKAEEPLPPLRDEQEFVFLAEARPVLVRVRVEADGKSLLAAWDDFMKYLFAYLDTNKDGVLSKDEAERTMNPEQLTLGSFGIFAGLNAKEKMEALDANKDGKVTLDELKTYYQKKNFTPFQFELNLNAPDPLAQLSYLGIRTDPDNATLSKSVFALLDTNKDGKISKAELMAAQAVLLERDENEDEILTTQELAPDAKPANNMMAAMASRAIGGNSKSAGNNYLQPITTPGQAPADLVKHMQSRYGKSGKDKDKAKKLSRQELGLDDNTFAALDADKDGALDEKELAAFVKRAPDVCVVLHFGQRKPNQAFLELSPVNGKPSLLADRVRERQDDLALFDLGKTRMELRHSDKTSKNVLGDILKAQLSALFKAADKDGDGYVDEKEAKASPQFRNFYKNLDRDGKGKVSEKEMFAYYDQMQEIAQRAKAACVTLVLKDQTRGLFDLLDTNRDGKLGLRELRQAPKLLERVAGKDSLSKDDLPHSYLLTLRRGSAQSDGIGAQEAVFDRLYGGGYDQEVQATRGPAWFRKMDKNRDGDVSRKEFLFSEEQFKKLDADGDGLISVEEAERAGALSRK